MRLLSLLPCLFLLTSAAHAELTDLRARTTGLDGQIWIGFDSQPSSLILEETAQGVRLVVEGVDVRSRVVSPAHTDLVRAVTLTPQAGLAHIDLDASRDWAGVSAELRQGGVLVSVQLGTTGLPADGGDVAQVRLEHTAATHPAQDAASPMEDGAQITTASASRQSTEPATETRPVVADAVPAPVPAPPPPSSGAVAPTPQPSVSSEDECERLARAVADDPWNERLLVPHAACLADQGQTREATGIYRQILAFEPENYAAAVALADLEEAAGNRDAALRLYQQAASHARSDAQAAAALQRARALEGGQ